MPEARVSAKGAILIPAELRRKYGLKPGDEVPFVDYGGHLTIAPVPRDPIGHARGLLAGGPSLTEALLKERAEELRREETKIRRGRS